MLAAASTVRPGLGFLPRNDNWFLNLQLRSLDQIGGGMYRPMWSGDTIHILKSIGENSLSTLCSIAVNHARQDFRNCSVKALEQLLEVENNDENIRQIIDTLALQTNDKHSIVRSNAIWAFVNIGNNALEDKKTIVRRLIADAISTLENIAQNDPDKSDRGIAWFAETAVSSIKSEPWFNQ